MTLESLIEEYQMKVASAKKYRNVAPPLSSMTFKASSTNAEIPSDIMIRCYEKFILDLQQVDQGQKKQKTI